MDFNAPTTLPEDFNWTSSTSGPFSQGNEITFNPSAERQHTNYHSLEGFTPLDNGGSEQTPHIAAELHSIPNEDVEMIGGTNRKANNHPTVNPPILPNARRSKHGNLDWEGHKDELRELYLDNGRSLKDTMRIMKQKYSMPESAKWYKEQFKDWGWQKNLPGQHAQWMKEKAEKRKREEDKDTVFFYGGLRWDKTDAERSATRSKKVRSESEVIDVDTPGDILYHTPTDTALSPPNASSSVRPRKELKRKHVAKASSVFETLDTQSDSESDKEIEEAENLALSWQRLTRSKLAALFGSARTSVQLGDSEKAEEMFLTALKGHESVLGATHEDTLKVAFAFASFYVEQDKFTKADRIIEGVSRAHISKFGMQNRRTRQVILQIVELLNGWARQNDALAFLARSKEMAEDDDVSDSSRRKKRITNRRTRICKPRDELSAVNLMHHTQGTISQGSPAGIEHSIEMARARIVANDDSVATFLKAIVLQCGSDPMGLEIQGLQARTELLRLYNKFAHNASQSQEFWSAMQIAEAATSYPGITKWSKDCFKSFELMEALLGLTAAVLKGNFVIPAERLFKRIITKAENSFGWDDERTIWAKITVGIIYQRHKGWAFAEQWFKHALAASVAANGDEDGISRALYAALEKRHFSYLSDEGRPFKTIFGVCGLTIRPNRLHLD